MKNKPREEDNLSGRRSIASHLRLAMVICPIALLGFADQACGSVADGGLDFTEKTILSWMQEPAVYQREGRSDPFLPFIQETLTRVAEPPREALTGMRRFEPGQLSLVSVVFAGDDALAMVQDSIGRGYVIREGTKIGRDGVVAQILPNQVIIKQQMPTISGGTRSQAMEMVLRKEGER
jgi:type IV pilus assembly protein PilP